MSTSTTPKAARMPQELRGMPKATPSTPEIQKPAERVVEPLAAKAILEITRGRSVQSRLLVGLCEYDGTVTARWAGREVRDAARGFLRKGRYLSPTSRRRRHPDGFPIAIEVIDSAEASRRGGRLGGKVPSAREVGEQRRRDLRKRRHDAITRDGMDPQGAFRRFT